MFDFILKSKHNLYYVISLNYPDFLSSG
jgi:hypothetical protein